MQSPLETRLPGHRFATAQAINCVIFAITLVVPYYPFSPYYGWYINVWLWRSLFSHLAFTSVAFCSACINVAYGFVQTRQRNRFFDEERVSLPEDQDCLVVNHPQTEEDFSHEFLLSPRVVEWIYRPEFEFTNVPHLPLRWCLRAAHAISAAIKWILGSLFLSLITLLENGDCFDTNDTFDVDGRLRASDNDSNFTGSFYNKPTIKYSDDDGDNENSNRDDETDDSSGLLLRERANSISVSGVDTSDDFHSRPVNYQSAPKMLPPTLLRPRYLCMLTRREDGSFGYKVHAAEGLNVKFVFISYTTTQFRNSPPQLGQDDTASQRTFTHDDRLTLTNLAIKAAQDKGLKAFWIDFECIKEDTHNSFKEDVYRICDVLRASSYMALMVGPNIRADGTHDSKSTKEEWLIEWGKRLWTVPEALLCPTQHDIGIIWRELDGSVKFESVAKRNLASRVWDDAEMMKLVDHYESSLQLTRLEVSVILLPRILERSKNQWLRADAIYAFQGLLRQRLQADATDTEFSAFAKLCIANDIGGLLERMLCLQPMNPHAKWHEFHDAQGVSLWNIRPAVQVAGVPDGSTLEIGARIALINWQSVAPVRIQLNADENLKCGRATRLSRFLIIYWQTHVLLFLGYECLLAFIDESDDLLDLQAVVVYLAISGAIAIAFSLLSPFVWRCWSLSTIKSAQARFFGIKGTPHLTKVESAIMGWNRNQLKDNETQRVSETGGPAGAHVYTLVDTVTMKATQFKAVRVPTVAIAVGQAKGKARIMLCSYDAEKRKFARETVLQMDARVMDHMHRVDHVRLSVYVD